MIIMFINIFIVIKTEITIQKKNNKTNFFNNFLRKNLSIST